MKHVKRALATNIRRLRLRAGITQVELARRAGTTQKNISAFETRAYQNPGLDLLVRIALALGVTRGGLRELFDD